MSAALLLGLLTSLPPASAATTFTAVGRWNLDAISPVGATGLRTTPNVVRPADRGVLDGATTVRRTAAPASASGSAALWFPGWDDGAPADGRVDPTASSVRIAHRPELDPGSAAFRVSVSVRPQDPRHVPGIDGSDTLNIVQKGLSGAGEDGQWKIEMSRDGRPECRVVGLAGNGQRRSVDVVPPTDSAAAAMEFTRGPGSGRGGYLITCVLTRGRVQLTLSRVGPTPGVRPVLLWRSPWTGAIDPGFTVVNDDDVWVGKKPDDVRAGDAFSGVIDDLELSRG